jgi:hypothetical protein
MAQLSASINVTGAVVQSPGKLAHVDGFGDSCIYFPEPNVFLRGTPAELAAFARAILGKVTTPERVFVGHADGQVDVTRKVGA